MILHKIYYYKMYVVILSSILYLLFTFIFIPALEIFINYYNLIN